MEAFLTAHPVVEGLLVVAMVFGFLVVLAAMATGLSRP